MCTLRFDAIGRYWFRLLCVLLILSGCKATHHFRYRYTMIAPPGGTEGIENEEVRIQLTPTPEAGVIQLTLANKSARPLAILWNQTHYIDPFGRRQQATETGMRWFFRLREWFAEDTQLAPGSEFRARIQPGAHQTYNPFTVSRQAGGETTFSASPRPLLPSSGNTPAIGKAYKGREFRFILALRIGTDETLYPFTFRITDVEVQ